MWFRRFLYKLTVKAFLKLCKWFGVDPNNDEQVHRMVHILTFIIVSDALLVELSIFITIAILKGF